MEPVPTTRFLGGYFLAAEAGTLGDDPDESTHNQGTGGPYTRHSKGCLDDVPWGTTECPRCSRPGDLLKQKVSRSTLGVPAWRGWCGVGSGGHGDRGSVEAEEGKKLETVEKNPGPKRGGGRGKAAENKSARSGRRYGRRREHRVRRGEGGGFGDG